LFVFFIGSLERGFVRYFADVGNQRILVSVTQAT